MGGGARIGGVELTQPRNIGGKLQNAVIVDVI
jgi:hypothetical protein